MRVDMAVIRAAQTESGAILACPDYRTYRYSWLRDGSFCAAALDVGGDTAASGAFHRWVAQRVLAFEGPMRRAIESVAVGETPGPDDYLPCRFSEAGVAPTGDGWGAFQMDGPGLWLWSLDRHAQAAGGRPSLGSLEQRAAALAAEYVVAMWRQPSYDAWEEHADRLASSTVAADLGGLLAAHRLGLAPGGMQLAVEGMRLELAARAARVGHLPRSDGDDAVDGSILWCGPLLGAFHPSHAAWRSTLSHVQSDLVGPDGGVHRYRGDTFYGGGQWPVVTAAYGLACLWRNEPGDHEQAEAALAWIEDQRDADGRLPEQSHEHLLDPAKLPEWEARWGPVATPLTWSHAMTVLLTEALARQL